MFCPMVSDLRHTDPDQGRRGSGVASSQSRCPAQTLGWVWSLLGNSGKHSHMSEINARFPCKASVSALGLP